MEEGEIVVQALGRSPFLGQVYSASTGRLFNLNLFPEDVLAGPVTVSTPMPSTDVVFTVVKSSEDRAHLLDVSASVSLSILGGTVKLKGFGKYLDSTDSDQDSTTISGLVRCRTVHKRLDLTNNGLKSSVDVDSDRLKSLGATHVVTAITYGGTLLGNLSESRSQAKLNKQIKGDFSLSVMQSFGKLTGAKGAATISQEERNQLENLSFSTTLVADYVNEGEEAPVTPKAMISAIQNGLPNFTSEVGDVVKPKTHGIPVDLVLTPLTHFDQISTEIVFRDLAETDLVTLRSFYDDLSRLDKRRRSLLLEVEQEVEMSDDNSTKYKDYFPSFYKTCLERSNTVQDLFLRSQTRLGVFLRDYRSQTNASETVATFLAAGKEEYDLEADNLDNDTELWQNLLQLKHAAAAHKYPLSTVQNITDAMNRGERDSIIVHLLPTSVGIASLLSAFRELGDGIREWRELMNEARGGGTIYLSLYADPLRDPVLMRLENTKGSISHALSTARQTSKPTCLMYGYRADLSRQSWMELNHEHWGVVVEPLTKKRYTGFLKDGLPHGTGTMIYANGFSYTGDWLLGKRDGNGVLRRRDRILVEGVFIDDKQEGNVIATPNVPVEVTVYREGKWTTSAIFAVQAGQPPHRQVEKIARVFGWESGQRYRLIPTLEIDNVPGVPSGHVKSPYIVVANGPLIESGPYPEKRESWDWPDDRVSWNGEEDSILSFNRRFYPFPPVLGPDPSDPAKPIHPSRRSRPIKLEAQLLG